MTGKLFVISAPSGAGKTTLVTTIIERIARYVPVKRVVTYTSKSARPTEIQGTDYHFLSEAEFEAKIGQGFFMEWSAAYGCYYGSARTVLEEVEQGQTYILIIDRVGAEKIAQQYDKAALIWIYTKGLEVLKERLESRETETEQQVCHRLECARREIEQELKTPLYRYHVLNDDFDRAVRKLEKIIRYELQQAGLFW